MSFIVAIDGPAGTGKGTMASRLSKKYNLVNIDTGATYRCVTLEMMNQNIGMDEEEKIAEMLKSIQIELSTEKGKQKVKKQEEQLNEKIKIINSVGSSSNWSFNGRMWFIRRKFK